MIRTQNPDRNPDKQLSAPVRIFYTSVLSNLSQKSTKQEANKIYKSILTLHNM